MSTLCGITESQFECIFPKIPDSSCPWQKNKYSAVVFTQGFPRGYSNIELHREIQTYSSKISRNITNRFEVNIFKIQNDEFEEKPIAICYSSKEKSKGHSKLVNARGKLGALKVSTRMSEDQYDEAGSFIPDRSKFEKGYDLISFPQELSDYEFFSNIFVPALENIYGKERVITQLLSTPVSSAGSSPAPSPSPSPLTIRSSPCPSPLTISASPVPQIDYSTVTWSSVEAYDCKVTSFKNEVFYLLSKNNEEFKLKPTVFHTFLNKFSSIDELIAHFRSIDDELPILRKSLPFCAEKKLQDYLKVPEKDRDNEKIQFLEKAIKNVKNQSLIADSLYEMRHIQNWGQFQANCVEALKCAGNHNQFHCVLQISIGTLLDGRNITRNEIKAIKATRSLMKTIEFVYYKNYTLFPNSFRQIGQDKLVSIHLKIHSS